MEIVRHVEKFQTLSGIEKEIAMANRQLALLNTANDQQRKAISTLVSLQSVGYSDKEIVELISLVNRWNGTGLGKNNGSNWANGLELKLDDRLNL